MHSPSTSAIRRGSPGPRSIDLLQHPERLRTLREAALLDGRADAGFDRLARLAARALGASVGLIGFVDGERFVLKSQEGLPQPWAGYRQPPLPSSLARYTVLAARPLAVEELRRHPLMRDDVAAAAAGLIAYLGVPVRDAAGHALGTLCVMDGVPRRWSEEEVRALQDVAECVSAEIELRLRHADRTKRSGPADPLPLPSGGAATPVLAGEAERIKDELISVVSHELRTPLTAMRGSLGLLAAGRFGELDPQGRRMVEIALTNAERLSRLVHDILDLERISQGQMRLVRCAADAAELMEEAVRLVRPTAEHAEVHVHLTPLHASLHVDADRVSKVLMHLLENAVKFSGAGDSVWVSAEARGGEVVFSVRDQGRGIPEHQRAAVFERFHQGDSSDSRRKGGLGLGLALCRGLVEAHGGRIWVEGDPGRGADFRFALPWQAKSTG